MSAVLQDDTVSELDCARALLRCYGVMLDSLEAVRQDSESLPELLIVAALSDDLTIKRDAAAGTVSRLGVRS